MRVKWYAYIGAILAFWALSVFGGLVPMLFNLLQPRFARWMPGDLGYEILRICANGIGCALAILAFEHITNGRTPVCGMVNCVIGAVIIVVIVVLCWLVNVLTLTYILSYGLMLAAYIWGIFRFSKQVSVK